MLLKFFKAGFCIALSVFFPSVLAQRPNTTSICDYYAETILGANTAANQKLLMVLLLHTTVLGNYTTPNVGIEVHGIAKPSTFNGKDVNLLKYFTGEVASTNDGKTPHGVAINLLDDGGATPLLKNMSSNGNTTSIQFNLFTHIESYFGVLLGCSKQGGSELPDYAGRASQYEVHRYMDLSAAELGFFNQQATLAVASLGFHASDVSIINSTLYDVFSQRCSPPITLSPSIPAFQNQLESVCINSDCPLNPNATCEAYPNKGLGMPPVVVNGTTANATQSGNASQTGTMVSATANSGVTGRMNEITEAKVQFWQVFAAVLILFFAA